MGRRQDEFDHHVTAITAARNMLYDAIREAYDDHMPIARLIGLVGFQNVQHILGPEAVEGWRIERGYAPKSR